ncbi:MAG: hypothetical protein K9K32_02485 [Halanaerobiales bacterium]|nr:hypothetical protein [Halanaerobiales bacterium]
MVKQFNYIIFVLIIIVLVISFALTYNGGNKITITENKYSNKNILVNIYNNNDKINLQMASINPDYKVEVSYGSNKSSTFAPGYSTYNLENLNFELKTYRKWLRIVWLPYQSIEIDLTREQLQQIPEDGLLKFKAEFADKLMNYYVEN